MNIYKHQLTYLLSIFLLSIVLVQGCDHSQTTGLINDAPNILLVLADDQSWLHTGISGDKMIQGVLFNNAFASCPSCTPSRTAILTGQEIWRTGEAGLLMGAIPKDLKLFSHILYDNGYHVGYTGKGWAPGNWGYLGLEKDPLIKAYNDRLETEIAYGIDQRNYTANFTDFLRSRPEGAPFFFWFGSTEPHREYQYGVGEKEANLKSEEIDVPSFKTVNT